MTDIDNGMSPTQLRKELEVEPYAYMVWGALIAFVRADGTATEPADVRAELHRLVRSEYDAWQAIAAATGARKFDRVTAALARLRELHP